VWFWRKYLRLSINNKTLLHKTTSGGTFMKKLFIFFLLTLCFCVFGSLDNEELLNLFNISPSVDSTPNSNQGNKINWKFKITNNAKNLTITDEALYYWSKDGYFYSLDSKTGVQHWKFKPTGFPCTAAVTSHDMVYFGTMSGQIIALNKHTGQEVWLFDIGGPLCESSIIVSPTLSNGLLFFGAHHSKFYALDARTGLQKWAFKTPVSLGTRLWKASIRSAVLTNDRIKAPVPVIHDGVIFFSCESNYLYAVNVYTGKEKWRFYSGSYAEVTPIIIDKKIYFGTVAGDFYAVDIVTGKQTWSSKTGYPIYCSPSATEETIYVGNIAGYAYALDAITGKERWRIKAACSINSFFVTANGLVYFSSDDGNIYAVDNEGHGKWKYQTGGRVRSSIAMIDGVLYFGSNYDYLYAVQVPPMFG
jgi:outer membrane protein assembly factor BamB